MKKVTVIMTGLFAALTVCATVTNASAKVLPGTIYIHVHNALGDKISGGATQFAVTLDSVSFYNVNQTTPCYTLTNIPYGQAATLNVNAKYSCTDVDRVQIKPGTTVIDGNTIQPYLALPITTIPNGPFSVKNSDTNFSLYVVQKTPPTTDKSGGGYNFGTMQLTSLVALD